MVGNVKTVQLSDNMVKDRIDKMARDCQNQLHETEENAIQLDETTTGESIMFHAALTFRSNHGQKQGI